MNINQKQFLSCILSGRLHLKERIELLYYVPESKSIIQKPSESLRHRGDNSFVLGVEVGFAVFILEHSHSRRFNTYLTYFTTFFYDDAIIVVEFLKINEFSIQIT
jgi:hypothetical protein